MINKVQLENLYNSQKMSIKQIAVLLECSHHKVAYWMTKHGIKRRTISDAVYAKANPNGDPFSVKQSYTPDEMLLMGVGLGLYWGEGNKKNQHSIRLGNTDPALILKFREFLVKLFDIDTSKLRYGLQIFSDMDQEAALSFWSQYLQEDRSKFQKVIVTPARSIGNYRQKTQHGVLTLHFNSKRLRDIIISMLPR